MQVLKSAQKLNLPQWMIGAGFVRNKVWDHLSGNTNRGHSTDVDLIYFDPLNTDESVEKQYDKELRALLNVDWSTKNQARMHVINSDEPYSSAADALAHWPETATCIAVSLKGDKPVLIAPHGIEDLVSMIVRTGPLFAEGAQRVKERVEEKKWVERWPTLTLAY